MACTFVTALFDLGTAEHNPKRRSSLTYLKLFERLSGISHPLVVYIEKKYLDKANAIIVQHTPTGIPRKVITREISELICYPYLEHMKGLPLLSNPVSNRDTYLLISDYQFKNIACS